MSRKTSLVLYVVDTTIVIIVIVVGTFINIMAVIITTDLTVVTLCEAQQAASQSFNEVLWIAI